MNDSSVNIISIVSGASAMGDKAFLPNPINVRIGDIVTWKNTDVETHTVTCGSSDDSSQKAVEFDSGLLDPDQSFEHKFEKVGHYHYSCMIHPSMNGEVIVS
jgi:plastocyanin